ncbi:LPS export ABC transporter ATP-binding protein, partial [Phascolarctobacterium faecium]
MIIETKDLVKEYSGRRVVNRVSITVEQGSVVGLLGPNGAGKTTTFYMIVGIERPDEGVVTLDGDDISSLAMYERARAGIGYLPQEASIFRKMTVEENILAILETTVLTEEERVNKMNSLIEEFRIEHIRKSKGTELSGGERRRVEIARALATDPAFILLDEPFAGIDPIAVSDIQGMIAHLAKRGIGILITDHNVRETLSIVDKAYI